jgi:hypothetical protein
VTVPRLSGSRRTRIAIAVVTAAAGGAACVARQRVPLDCVPEQVTVFVDQQALEELPETLELRSDQPHKVFLKGLGYEPHLVVLTLEIEEDGGASPGGPDPAGATP